MLLMACAITGLETVFDERENRRKRTVEVGRCMDCSRHPHIATAYFR
jgi:hypothetical protein